MILRQKGISQTAYNLAAEKPFCRLRDRMAAAAERNKKYVKSTEGE